MLASFSSLSLGRGGLNYGSQPKGTQSIMIGEEGGTWGYVKGGMKLWQSLSHPSDVSRHPGQKSSQCLALKSHLCSTKLVRVHNLPHTAPPAADKVVKYMSLSGDIFTFQLYPSIQTPVAPWLFYRSLITPIIDQK